VPRKPTPRTALRKSDSNNAADSDRSVALTFKGARRAFEPPPAADHVCPQAASRRNAAVRTTTRYWSSFIGWPIAGAFTIAVPPTAVAAGLDLSSTLDVTASVVVPVLRRCGLADAFPWQPRAVGSRYSPTAESPIHLYGGRSRGAKNGVDRTGVPVGRRESPNHLQLALQRQGRIRSYCRRIRAHLCRHAVVRSRTTAIVPYCRRNPSGPRDQVRCGGSTTAEDVTAGMCSHTRSCNRVKFRRMSQ
jgi:hypothetical protein